jgi:hypothetical protein
MPNFCISEAKERLLKSINSVNENILKKKNLLLSYHAQCSTSWLQIDLLDKEEFNLKGQQLLETEALSKQSYLVRNQIN